MTLSYGKPSSIIASAPRAHAVIRQQVAYPILPHTMISLPAEARLYRADRQNPLLFRLFECVQDPTGDLEAKWDTSQGVLPICPTSAFIRQCNPVAHIGNWGSSNSPWVSTTFTFAYIAFECNRRTVCPKAERSDGGRVHFVPFCLLRLMSIVCRTIYLCRRRITSSHGQSMHERYRSFRTVCG